MVAGARYVQEKKIFYRVATYRIEMIDHYHHCRPAWNLRAFILLG